MLRHRSTPSACTRTGSLQPTSARRPSPWGYRTSAWQSAAGECQTASRAAACRLLARPRHPQPRNAKTAPVRPGRLAYYDRSGCGDRI
ncbi:hypothetical protein D3227_22050 [Mesorhizobium waimense]|uniref:Uncharacterized protein n=1 Tax=Mesorhizobium waimense TaxID=1300307 RepID=A0A3A5KJM4_9HYPH|nr:hypothetical protein D3227_22050 [Mesorhizobium waimense]